MTFADLLMANGLLVDGEGDTQSDLVIQVPQSATIPRSRTLVAYWQLLAGDCVTGCSANKDSGETTITGSSVQYTSVSRDPEVRLDFPR